MRKILILIAVMFTFSSYIYSQTDTTTNEKNGEKVKKGLSLGGVPAIAYDSDLGFLYGVILNFYHYGDGSNYPNYNHSLYLEWSRTTKGSGKNIIEYDARNLIPNTRLKAELSYLTEQALDFYGFNGSTNYFGEEYLDNTDTTNYISRLYYRHDRKMWRAGVNMEGQIIGKKLRWLGGITYNNVKIGSLDLATLNKDKEANEMLPDTATLYDKYVKWGVISADQKNGGITTTINAGLVYDTRDIESSPNKGIWAELLLQAAPSFLGNDYAYTRMMLTHRQYLTVVKQKLVFAYRLSVQTKLSGEMPFYMLPFYVSSNNIKDGLGGSKTLRGVLRNRVVGDGIALANAELRWTFLRKVIANQNLSLTLSGFADMGQVIDPYDFDQSGVTDGYGFTKQQNLDMMNFTDEKLHLSYGAGLHIALNTNFIIAVDYGLAGSPQDGKSGLYIALNYIF
jgi:outer membrane protein assembly factor BamA